MNRAALVVQSFAREAADDVLHRSITEAIASGSDWKLEIFAAECNRRIRVAAEQIRIGV
jgi:hypothetical protein